MGRQNGCIIPSRGDRIELIRTGGESPFSLAHVRARQAASRDEKETV